MEMIITKNAKTVGAMLAGGMILMIALTAKYVVATMPKKQVDIKMIVGK